MNQTFNKIGPLVLKLWQCKVANTKKCHFEKSPNNVFIIKLVVCIIIYFWCRRTGETDSVEKPKSIHGTPFGEVAVPKKWTSCNVTHFGREGHIYIIFSPLSCYIFFFMTLVKLKTLFVYCWFHRLLKNPQRNRPRVHYFHEGFKSEFAYSCKSIFVLSQVIYRSIVSLSPCLMS